MTVELVSAGKELFRLRVKEVLFPCVAFGVAVSILSFVSVSESRRGVVDGLRADVLAPADV